MYDTDMILKEFSLPIQYISKVKEIDDSVIEELECIKSKDDNIKPMYHYVFSPTNVFSKMIMKHWAKYYTTDKTFLTESIHLYKTYNPTTKIIDNADIETTWKSIKNDDGFIQKYQYIDWNHIKMFNRSSIFLFYLSIYTLLAPILSLLTPVFFLFIPFLILKLKKIPITMGKYLEVLKTVIQRNAVGALFTKFDGANIKEKVSLLVSVGFYIFQMYQNILVCYRFVGNFSVIHKYIDEIRNYLHTVKDNMIEFKNTTSTLTSYSEFNNTLNDKLQQVERILKNVDSIHPLSYSVTNFMETGKLMKEFYLMNESKEMQDTMAYCFGFSGYLQSIIELQKNDKIQFCTYSNKKIAFTNVYYPPLKESKSVQKNTYSLHKNYIITGPNASGKTTLLKTSFLNMLFSQQFGGGFYDSASIVPQDYFYCYINIPDTSGRDSLFQAEARRCKDILDLITKKSSKKHFIIFDELYSGTNPYEASASAYGYLKYLKQKTNVRFMLTTHFIDLCNNLDKQPGITNKHMETKVIGNQLSYQYKIKSGISNIKGGIQVLYDLDYPEDITKEANTILNN